MTEQTNKVNFLDDKRPVPEPFNWIVVFNIGVVARKEYEEIGYAGVTPVQMVGFNKDVVFPTYRISGENLVDLKEALLKSMDDFFTQVAEHHNKEKSAAVVDQNGKTQQD